eukprot:788404-Alexandrium_andersonii.AAC.1
MESRGWAVRRDSPGMAARSILQTHGGHLAWWQGKREARQPCSSARGEIERCGEECHQGAALESEGSERLAAE